MIDAPQDWGGFNGSERAQFSWRPLADVQERSIRFLDYPFLQSSAFHLLAGIKNSGKGTWLAHTAARVTRGEFGPRRNVLWLALGEDAYSLDVRPRIRAAGGDVSCVSVLEGYGFRLPDHAPDLEEKIRETQALLVIVDPLGGATTGDTNSDTSVRPMLQALNTISDATESTVIGVRHITNKARGRDSGTLSAILGASDWVNVPRVVLALLHDDVDPSMRHLFMVTGNRAPDDEPGVMLSIEGVEVEGLDSDITRVRMIGESHKDPDELLSAKRAHRTSRSDTARHLLLEILQQVPGAEMDSDELDAEAARRVGLSARTIRDVRMAMNREGLVRARPVKDEVGTVLAWMAVLTNAGIAHLRSAYTATPYQSLPQSQRSSPPPPSSSSSSSSTGRSLVVGAVENVDNSETPAKEADFFHNPVDNFESRVVSERQSYDSGDLQGFSLKDPANNHSREKVNGVRTSHHQQTAFVLPESYDLPIDTTLAPGLTPSVPVGTVPESAPNLPEDAPEWERRFWQDKRGAPK